MALLRKPHLDCPRGHELVRIAWRRPGKPLEVVTVCPVCDRDYGQCCTLALLNPICGTLGCAQAAAPGEPYCPRCAEELDALRAVAWRRARERKAT